MSSTRSPCALWFVLWAAASTGCAPALSSFTPAHVAPRKHVQAEVGIDVSVPTGTIGEVVEAGEALSAAAEDRELTEAEQQQLFRAGAALALNPPSATPHFGVGYTALERFELNGRYSIGALRLGARYQLLEQAFDGVDLSAGIGGARYVYEFPVSDQIPIVHLKDFTRWQLDLPLLVGRHGSWYRVWGGPRVLLTFYGTELELKQPAIPGVTSEKAVLASLGGVATYVGAQAGVAVGYKHVFFALELTLAKFWTTAELQLGTERRDIELDSFVIYPGFGLMLEI